MHKLITLKYYAALLAISVLTLYLSWVGFTSSDDAYYVTSGLGWLHEFPYVATHFGEIRAGIGIPIALMIALFGESEFTVTLSTCVFLVATAFLTFAMLSRVIGQTPAFMTSAILVTIPLFAIHSTIPCADLPALFFVAGSFWLFWLACQREDRLWLLLIAGVSAAIAFSAHELTLGLLLFYGVLFVLGVGIKRYEYWLMAIGFLFIIGIECIYYWVMTGDPLYRFTLLLQGTAIQDRNEIGFLQITVGTPHIWAPIDPVLMFFTNHYFSLLGFLIMPAMWWVLKDWRSQSLALRLARLLLCLGIVWFLLAAIELRNLWLLPRYYMVAAYSFFLVSAIWVYVKIWPQRRQLVTGGMIVFVLINLGLISLDNNNPRFGERALVDYLGESEGSIHTDPLTAANAEFFCRWASQDCGRIVAAPPVSGSTFFYNPKSANRPNRFVTPDKVKLYAVNKQWQEIWKKQAPRKVSAVIAEKMGIISLLPQVLVLKLEGPNTVVSVYRLPE
ncbi:MAG: glycosyltransferase family 39 protein [Methylobacter sp.]|nr:glycosyltransferase family 39 protein [Methylobacter sp.]